ncbi:hypothetical protein [Rhizobium sp. R339]|uniref:hypothetical protein n=1 Tax=Rhizobium sp. R339 TaxID=1764273 RepID=UPI001FD8CE38|nr:hypothetical protein [Rhizobium sp. R339]
MPALVVAKAWKPIAARIRAVPTSQGFGMMNAPGASCSNRNADFLSLTGSSLQTLHFTGLIHSFEEIV